MIKISSIPDKERQYQIYFGVEEQAALGNPERIVLRFVGIVDGEPTIQIQKPLALDNKTHKLINGATKVGNIPYDISGTYVLEKIDDDTFILIRHGL
jgi:hypothetical protein